MADFIPSADDAFDHFTKVLGPVVVDPTNPLKIPFNVVSAWTNADATWNTAWSAWEAMTPAMQSALQTKDAARHGLETVAREVNNAAQANVTLTDAERATAGLPVRKTSHTPVPAPSTAPMIFKLDNEHLLQRLHFADSAHPSSKAKPVGAALCEIRQQIVAARWRGPRGPEGDAVAGDGFASAAPHGLRRGGHGQDGVLRAALGQRQGRTGTVERD